MTEPLEGRRVPEVVFRVLENGRMSAIASSELFAGRNVVLFALPGAFTPTCSNRHVPRFNELAQEFWSQGIDELICLAVNDPYVMAAWARDLGADRLTFIPDADGEFTHQLGMLTNKRESGLGLRSRRYAMLVRDRVIEKAFVEPEAEGDPYTVSDADTMLRFLNPLSPALTPATMFAREGCPFCARAKRLLAEHDLPYECIYLGEGVTTQSVLAATGAATVPQVFIGGRHVGGAEALEAYFRERDGSREVVPEGEVCAA